MELVPGIPMVVCAYGFAPSEVVELVVSGPHGWVWRDRQAANELGGAGWEIDDLPVPIEGDFVLEATQGLVRIEKAVPVRFDSLVAGVIPQQIAIGDTANLVVAGGPPDTAVSAYLYRVEQPDGYRFAADLGAVQLDANGEGSLALTPRSGDPTGTYLIEVPWPPGEEGGNGPTFQIQRAAGDALAYLSDGIRDDVGGCGPPEGDLPVLALAGVECHLGSDLADSVGFYLFNDRNDPLQPYYERLAEQDIEPDSGNCDAGQPGDRAWSDDEMDRVGCFVNDQGFANVRWTLASGPIYIGVLGNDDDIGALMDWSSGSLEGTNLWVQP